MITKEPNATPDVLVDPDWENRTLDTAIATLEDVMECDESAVFIKWVPLTEVLRGKADGPDGGPKVPLLYVLFSEVIAKRARAAMPRLHIDASGRTWPAHAICLASLPSRQLLEGDRLRTTIRRGVEEFLLKHNVTRLNQRLGAPAHA